MHGLFYIFRSKPPYKAAVLDFTAKQVYNLVVAEVGGKIL